LPKPTRPLSIDRREVVPLYYQIRHKLLDNIVAGRFDPATPLPSEQEIARQAGVSRMTARQALKSLCQMGATYSVRGRGTFASGTRLVKDFRQVQSFSEEMKARGLAPGARLLSIRTARASKDVAHALKLEKDERVIRLSRVRLASGSPMGIETSHLPAKLCPGLGRDFDAGDSLYSVLEARYGIRIVTADEVVEAGPARRRDAACLGIVPGTAVFFFTRTSYLRDGQPAEYVTSTYRADRYRLEIRLTRAWQ